LIHRLCQSPRYFFEHLKDVLIKAGFIQSQADSCLFISENVICLVYLDDMLFYSANETDIDFLLEKLRQLKMNLKVEDDVFGSLGDGNRIELTQTGLIKRIWKKCELKDQTQSNTRRDRSMTSR